MYIYINIQRVKIIRVLETKIEMYCLVRTFGLV